MAFINNIINKKPETGSENRLLNIHLYTAEDILEGNKSKKISECFAVISLKDLSGRPIKSEKVKTKVHTSKQKDGQLVVTFDESCQLGRLYNLSYKDNLPSLSIELFHSSQFSVNEVPLGFCSFDLSGVKTVKPGEESSAPVYKLELERCGKMTYVKGFVNVRLSFNREAEDEADEENQLSDSDGGEAASPDADDDDDADGTTQADDILPNQLQVKVLRAKNLPLMEKNLFGTAISTNSRVTLTLNSSENRRLYKHKTAVQKKNTNPLYQETFFVDNRVLNKYVKDNKVLNNIPIAGGIGQTFQQDTDSAVAFSSLSSILVEVKEASDLINIKSAYIGACLISLDPYLKAPLKKKTSKGKNKQWYTLYNKDLVADGQNHGEIELELTWSYDDNLNEETKLMKTNADLKSKEQDSRRKNNIFLKGIDSIGKKLGLESDSDLTADEDDDQYDEGDVSERRGDGQKDDKAKAEELEEKRKHEADKKTELENISISDGDYQVQVHIIEARDLKPKNLNGTSDPVVFISCLGEKRYTKIKKNVVSCVFDDVFILNFKGLTREEVEGEIIKVSCYDSGLVSAKNNLIGSFAIDLATVYTRNKQHEFYRQWVALINDEDLEDDSSIQGYMKLSISVVGPGDKKVVHNEEEEIKKEQSAEAKCGNDIGSLILTTPIIIKTFKYIVVKLYKAEGLPIMDGMIGTSFATLRRAGTDAFVKLSFGGAKPLKSKVVTIQGESRLQINPVFNAELWYPVSVPTLTQQIKISVWDKDSTSDELIGVITAKYNEIIKMAAEGNKKKKELCWYNLYGSPEFKTEKLGANLKKGLENVVQKTIQNFSEDIDWEAHYNNVPAKASTYKGRLLMNIRIEDKPPKEIDQLLVKPFRLKMPALKQKNLPPTTLYSLQALVLNGADLPSATFGPILNEQYRVRVSIGMNEVSTRPVKADVGQARWQEYLELDAIELPSSMDHIPDIFVYLVRDDNKPICFIRIKPWKAVTDENGVTSNQFIGFESQAQWHLLEEDKVINALSDGTFPGNLLLNLRFGPTAQKGESSQELKSTLLNIKKASPYKMRIHVYQVRDLMPKSASGTVEGSSSNGLMDPYLKMSFMGTSIKTKKKKKTNNPSFFETHTLNNVMINDYDDFRYSSPLNFRIYDSNLITGDQYLGQTCFYLTDAIVCNKEFVNPQDPSTWSEIKSLPVDGRQELQIGVAQPVYPDPTWRSFFFEKPGDGNGYLLVHVDLIPIDNIAKSKEESKIVPVPIIPETVDGFIELIIIGMRELAPYNYQAIQNSFLDIELSSFGTKYKSFTNNSKFPLPSDPNFLENIVMPCRLPKKSIYSTPLLVKAKDSRLGGYLKPTVGLCQIDLATKLPWDEATYVAPQQDVFINDKTLLENDELSKDQMLDRLNGKDSLMESYNQQRADDFVISNEPVKVTSLISEFRDEEDTGAGIFGALNYIDFYGVNKKKKQASDFLKDADLLEEEVEEAPPKWIINRQILDDSLESVFLTTPFETYHLTRGSYNASIKSVGKLKGLVRVVRTEEEITASPMLPENLMKYLMKPKKYNIRLYCLKANQLDELDKDIFGNKSKSDPYLKVTLGKQVFNDRSNAVDNVTDLDLYKVIEMETELPGVSQLNISFFNRNMISNDELIGKTSIDLEDRWFDQRWQSYGEENMIVPGQLDTQNDNDSKNNLRWKTKPVERRYLYAPGFTLDRGIFECWLDIMTAEEAATFPPDDIALPPRQIFEVRVVIWKTKNVPAMDSFEGMSDLFVKAWPEGCKPLETDTHWRCKNGKASFNWRLKFDVELGNNTKAMKFPYFYLQLWDRDILKWNDCAGEGVINLGKFYRKAYRNNAAIKLFEKKKGLAAKRAMKMRDNKYLDRILIDDEKDIPPEEREEDGSAQEPEDMLDIDATRQRLKNQGFTHEPTQERIEDHYNRINNVARETLDSDDEDWDGPDCATENDDEEDDGHGFFPKDGYSKVGKKGKKTKKSKYGNMIKQTPPGLKVKKYTSEELRQMAEARAAKAAEQRTLLQRLQFWKKAPEPALDEGEDAPLLFKKSKTEEKETETDDIKAFVNTIKNLTGLWDIDPEDSAWYHLEQRDPKDPTQVTPMGSICYSIQIWPKVQAVQMPVGGARNEPNTNPFLPPPVGRFRFSFNPFILGSELCGPVLCAKFFCCLLCLAFIALMIFCQPFLNIIINLIFVVY